MSEGNGSKSPVSQAADDVRRELARTITDPNQLVDVVLGRIERLNYPNVSRAAEAADKVRAQLPRVRGLLADWVSRYATPTQCQELGQLLWDLEVEALKLAAPLPPPPSFYDNLKGHWCGMQDIGWSSEELEQLCRFAKGGATGTDDVAGFTAGTVTLKSGATVERRLVIESLMPRDGSVTADEWHQNSLRLRLRRGASAQGSSRAVQFGACTNHRSACLGYL